jgi:hypothetical protein
MIHIFGDSFSKTTWPDIVTTKIGVEHRNYAVVGETNLFILKTLIENLQNIEKGDTIIIQTSGQGRLNVRNQIIYGDQIYYGLKRYPEKGFTHSECDIIQKWYTTFYLPEIVQQDPYIDSIIHLANHLSKEFKVILWNLTALGFEGTQNINDNVQTSPKIPKSSLWLDLSEDGKKGWVQIMMERGLGCSDVDPHPTVKGDELIASEIIKKL